MERLRALIDRDRQDTERLSMEKQSYEDRISTMMREKEMLEDTFKTLDTKVAQMRRYKYGWPVYLDKSSSDLQAAMKLCFTDHIKYLCIKFEIGGCNYVKH